LKEIKEFVKRNSFTLFVGGTLLGYSLYQLSKRGNEHKIKSEDEVIKETAKKLLEPVKIIEVENYVTRKEYEEELNDIIGNMYRHKYVTLVGPKGSGKKTLLKHVLNGKKGIVFVKYDGETTMENFQKKLFEAIDIQIKPWKSCNFYFFDIFS
jgi:ATPase subunit of ABC transporter with duplicated ATPase domains